MDIKVAIEILKCKLSYEESEIEKINSDVYNLDFSIQALRLAIEKLEYIKRGDVEID